MKLLNRQIKNKKKISVIQFKGMINYSTNICSHQVLNPCSNLSRMLTAESVHQEWTKEYQQILDKMTWDIWPQRSHIMAPLTALTSVNVA